MRGTALPSRGARASVHASNHVMSRPLPCCVVRLKDLLGPVTREKKKKKGETAPCGARPSPREARSVAMRASAASPGVGVSVQGLGCRVWGSYLRLLDLCITQL